MITHLAGALPGWLSTVVAQVPVDQARAEVPQFEKVGWSLVIAVGWMTAYLCGIRRAHLDRRLAIPVVAVPFNLAWELCFGFVYVAWTPPVGVASIMAWFVIDLVILVQAFRFGWHDVPWAERRLVPWILAAAVPFAVLFMVLMTRELHDLDGAYSAFGLNMFMSFAFITMLRRRGSTAGQTIYIAVGKMVGTAGSSALFSLFYPHRPMLYLLYVTDAALDLIYVVLLYRQFRAEGRDPWRVV